MVDRQVLEQAPGGGRRQMLHDICDVLRGSSNCMHAYVSMRTASAAQCKGTCGSKCDDAVKTAALGSGSGETSAPAKNNSSGGGSGMAAAAAALAAAAAQAAAAALVPPKQWRWPRGWQWQWLYPKSRCSLVHWRVYGHVYRHWYMHVHKHVYQHGYTRNMCTRVYR